ncbi:hypothetical protein Scep_019275 [Stephania cephalantha]|uniref:Uncharacterized protein n=1 Tax=Stephania cephalantha TaxID=152367 RepID=A0AAP0IAD9_9MAGN
MPHSWVGIDHSIPVSKTLPVPIFGRPAATSLSTLVRHQSFASPSRYIEVKVTFWHSSVPVVAKYCSMSQRKFSSSLALRLPENFFGSCTWFEISPQRQPPRIRPRLSLAAFTSIAISSTLSGVFSHRTHISLSSSSNLVSHIAIVASCDSSQATKDATNISKPSRRCSNLEDPTVSTRTDMLAIVCSK